MVKKIPRVRLGRVPKGKFNLLKRHTKMIGKFHIGYSPDLDALNGRLTAQVWVDKILVDKATLKLPASQTSGIKMSEFAANAQFGSAPDAAKKFKMMKKVKDVEKWLKNPI